MNTYKWIGSMIAVLFLLTGCGSDETNGVATKSEEKKEEKAVTEAIKNEQAPRTIEEVNQQQSGTLVKEYEEKIKKLDRSDFEDFKQKEIDPQLEKELTSFMKENKDASSDDIYNYLVHLVGIGTYQEASEKMESFEPSFKGQDADLPTGPDTVQTEEGKSIEMKRNSVILVDASGSMKGKVSGEEKMVLAKEAVKEFAHNLPEDENVSLVVYGHTGSNEENDKEFSCKGVETIYEMNRYDSTLFGQAMNGFEAVGWTPLTAAIESAKNILQPYEGKEYENTVYIVSDGIETCGGDPAKVAESLVDSNIKAKVNIIGFDVDDEGQNQLKAVAEAGGGKYATVRTKEELREEIIEKWRPSMIDLAWSHTAGINPWDHLAEMKRFDKDKETYQTLANREYSMLSSGLQYLSNHNLLDRETSEKVLTLISDMQKLKLDYASHMREKKFAEMEAEVERIDAQIKEWKEKWNKELNTDF
ncbi:vWA domain-containing protein [Metabacillus iocasae]|uniref:VWFA domain-containing protein n=1 Tax=Priestia iocasae TaxID=2291674 RepID=A0ABS2QWB0_9BACI|nr:VWA domain-containing protein [Metabacillus iocasae]MBM7703685.1 hypothetical protein [Metabacillus iocasae]